VLAEAFAALQQAGLRSEPRWWLSSHLRGLQALEEA
jgi:hypothetical protein